MWSCLLLTDAGGDPVVFSGVSVVPAGDPIVLLDAVTRAGTGHLLVVTPPALAAAMHTGVTITVGRRPELSISWLISRHAPLAILSALALARAATDDPAIGVGLTQRILENSWSGAWAGSVTKLNEPNPRFGQHLRSMLPGSGFLVRQAPEPQVLGKPRPGDVPPAGMDRVLLVQDSGVPTPVAERLSEAEGVTAVRQVALPGAWTSVYGTDKTGQLALMPTSPQPLIGQVTHRCPACRLDLISAVCPFCRIIARPVQPPVSTASTGSTPISTSTAKELAEALNPNPASGELVVMTPMSSPPETTHPPDAPPPSAGQAGTQLIAHPAKPAQPGGPA